MKIMLLRKGQPYFIRGAGADESRLHFGDHLERR